MENGAIASALRRYAESLALVEPGGFRARAYRLAAEAIWRWPEPVAALWAKGRLAEIEHVGPGIARRIDELCRTGRIADLDALAKEAPPSLAELLEIEGIGFTTAKRLHDVLGVSDLASLEEAARAGRLRTVPGFGAKKEAQVLASLERARARGPRRAPLGLADGEARAIAQALSRHAAVSAVAIAGALRRRVTLVDEIEVVVATREPEAVLAFARAIAGGGETARVVPSDGPSRSPSVSASSDEHSIRTRTLRGLPLWVRAAAPETFGALLLVATGAPDHVAALALRARERGLVLDERGLTGGRGALQRCDSEEAIYAALALPFIPPELRDDARSIALAEAGRLPRLVEASDLRGDLHAHTVASDGHATLVEMARAAAALGRDYLAITDHSQALTIARGLDERRIRAQWPELEAVAGEVGIRLLRGVEADILEDGRVDLGDELLSELDLVVGSLHSHLRMDRARMTERVVRAFESGRVDVWGHPTGRKLGGRPGIDVDWDVVLEAAREHGVALEVNSLPDRLDLDGDLIGRVLEAGVKLAIDTDSHDTEQLARIDLGVSQARRGGAEPRHVINALAFEALADLRARHHPRRARSS